ncbi:MAG: hypothetical protein IPI60_08300 [Saprospiraceae bacterium]|nr:hypothetical protein [Saprospiraceae bacterium]
MRIAFLFLIFIGIISCKNNNDSSESTNSDLAKDSTEITDVVKEEKGPYTPETDKEDKNILIIDGTKMLDGELNASTNKLTYRIKGSTSKEMVIQLMSQNQDIFFNLRVEEGEIIAEKKRKYMFTVASDEVLVIDVTSDKPMTSKAVINTIISQL